MNRKIIIEKDEDIDLEMVRQIVLNRLKMDRAWSQFDYNWDVEYEPKFKFGNLRSKFLLLVNEVMWQLIIQGVLTIGCNSSNPCLPFFRITEYGEKVLEEEAFVAHDPDGYLRDLSELKGDIFTDVSVKYMNEALNCFDRGCYLSSVLLIGIASESVFNNFCISIKDKLADSTQKKIDLKISLKKRHDFIIAKYNNIPNQDKLKIGSDSIDSSLNTLSVLIRKQRNELGHPQENPPQITRDQAFMFFRLFPVCVSDLTFYANYISVNPL